jgi:aspartate/methionine/tyrosine aminotransferase
MTEQLDRATELSYSAPRGGPCIFLHVGALAVTPEEFHRRLLVDHGVSTDPGGPFGSEAHVRLPFGGEPEDVREAGARVAEAAASAGTA